MMDHAKLLVVCFTLSSSPSCFAFFPPMKLISRFYHSCIFVISSFQVFRFFFPTILHLKWLCPFLRGCSKIMCSLCLMRWQVSHQWFLFHFHIFLDKFLITLNVRDIFLHLQIINLTVSCLVEDRWWEVFTDSDKIWRAWLCSIDQYISQRCGIKLIRT